MVEPFSISITIGASEKNVKSQSFLYRRIAVVNVSVDKVCITVDTLVIVAQRELNKERIPDKCSDDRLDIEFIPSKIKFKKFELYITIVE